MKTLYFLINHTRMKIATADSYGIGKALLKLEWALTDDIDFLEETAVNIPGLVVMNGYSIDYKYERPSNH